MATATENDPFLGRVFKDAFEIQKKLGEGGFGAVYRAMQLAVERPVAVKVLRPDRAADPKIRETMVKRFRREAISTSKLSHPNTVRLIDFGEDADGVLFLVLELLEGRELAEVLEKEAPLAPARVARICRQICKSLAEAHGHGIIHRDLKPANVFLVRYDGSDDFVKVMDFGIAALQESNQDHKLTQTGMTQGTPRYMAPEQAMAQETSPATDLYALGCMIYEMLTSRPVFDHETPLAVSLAHVREAPKALVMEGVADSVVRAWNGLLAKLLEKQPKARPQSAAEVAAELERLEQLSQGIEAPNAPTIDEVGLTLPQTPAASLRVNPDGSIGAPPHLQTVQSFGQSFGGGPSRTMTSTGTAGLEVPREPAWKIAAAVGAVVLLGGGAGAWFLLGGKGESGDGTKTAQAATIAAETAPAPPVSVDPPAPPAPAGEKAPATAEANEAKAPVEAAAPAAPEPPRFAHMKVVSTPPGAEIYRTVGADRLLLCATPCDQPVAPGTGPEVLEITKAGHKPIKVQAVLTAGDTFDQTYTLQAEEAPKTVTASHRGPSKVKTGTTEKAAPAAAPEPPKEEKKKLLPGFRDDTAPAKKKLLPALRP